MAVTGLPRRGVTSTEFLAAGLLVCALVGTWLRDGVAGNIRLATAGTVFCGVFLQAVPFLVLGVIISGLVAAFVSPQRLAGWLPKRPVPAVVAAGLARGPVLPGGDDETPPRPQDPAALAQEARLVRHVLACGRDGAGDEREKVREGCGFSGGPDSRLQTRSKELSSKGRLRASATRKCVWSESPSFTDRRLACSHCRKLRVIPVTSLP